MGLLSRNPETRLGYHGVHEIKNHPFCKKINWEHIFEKKIKPPLRPHLRSANFDPEYDSLKIDNDYFVQPEYDDTHFEGFEYTMGDVISSKNQNYASNYSILTNTTTISCNTSRNANTFEESRKNRSEVWSTDYSRTEDLSIQSKPARKIEFK